MGILERVFPQTKAEQAYHGFESYVVPPAPNAFTNGVDAAMSIATVYRSVDLIATNISQLTLETYKGKDKVDSPLVVRQPDSNRSLSSFLKRIAYSLTLHGNAYLFKTHNSAGQVMNLEVLDPTAVQVEHNSAGRKTYVYDSKTYGDNKIVHLRRAEVPGHDLGVGPLEAYRKGIRSALAMRDYGTRTAGDKGVPTGILKVKSELSAEKAERLLKRWNEVVDRGGIMVVDGETDFMAMSLSAADMQFIENVKLTDLQIARIYGIPAAYLDIEVGGTSLTYTNLTTLNRQFVQNTLGGYLTEIEDAISASLPRGTHVKFDLSNLLRGDDKERFENYNTALEGGWMNIDEVRDKEGLPPITEKETTPVVTEK